MTAEGAFLRYNEAVLKSVRLKNFKLHKSTSIEAAPITVFIGPNNSGKSSIFQALLILRQATHQTNEFLLPSIPQRRNTTDDEPFLFPPDATIGPGEFANVVRRPSADLQIGCEGELQPDEAAVGLVRGAGAVQVSLDAYVRDNRLVRHEGWIKCQYGEGRWSFPSPASSGNLSVDGIPVELRSVQYFQLIQAIYSFAGHVPEPHMREMNDLALFLGSAPSKLLRSLHPVLPLRGFEEWAYPSTKFPGTENLDRLVLSDRTVALTNALAAKSRLRAQISERLKSLVDVGIDFETASAHRVKVFATSAGAGRAEMLFLNEGTGANQLPFILVPIALAQPNETILLSEPEAHLHPKAQCELTRMLLTVAKKENIQFFIETHSEHVLHTILNAVAKGEWDRDEVALHYFQNKNGTAEVGKREINQFGQVDGGLPDFFEQSLAELTDYLKALRKP